MFVSKCHFLKDLELLIQLALEFFISVNRVSVYFLQTLSYFTE